MVLIWVGPTATVSADRWVILMVDRPLTAPCSLMDIAEAVPQPAYSTPAPTMVQPPEIPAPEVITPEEATIIVPRALTQGLSTAAEAAEAHPTTTVAATADLPMAEDALPEVAEDARQAVAAVHAEVADELHEYHLLN